MLFAVSGMLSIAGAGCADTSAHAAASSAAAAPAARSLRPPPPRDRPPAPRTPKSAAASAGPTRSSRSIPAPAFANKPAPAPVAAAPCPGQAHPEMWDGHGKCEGVASFYAGKFIGRRTANGERYTGRKLSAAHRVLDFGTFVKVTRLDNGLSVIVRINDRGPYIDGRIIDLSPAAAKRLHMIQTGVTQVKLEVVAPWMAEEYAAQRRIRAPRTPTELVPWVFISQRAI